MCKIGPNIGIEKSIYIFWIGIPNAEFRFGKKSCSDSHNFIEKLYTSRNYWQMSLVMDSVASEYDENKCHDSSWTLVAHGSVAATLFDIRIVRLKGTFRRSTALNVRLHNVANASNAVWKIRLCSPSTNIRLADRIKTPGEEIIPDIKQRQCHLKILCVLLVAFEKGSFARARLIPDQDVVAAKENVVFFLLWRARTAVRLPHAFVTVFEPLARFVEVVDGRAEGRLLHRAALVDHQHAIAAVRPVLLRVELAVEVVNQPLEQRILTITRQVDVSSVVVFRRTKPRWLVNKVQKWICCRTSNKDSENFHLSSGVSLISSGKNFFYDRK